MVITWLKGVTRVKGGKYTREISGYRCSNCSNFVLKQIRTCPSCGGEYLGKIIGEDKKG